MSGGITATEIAAYATAAGAAVGAVGALTQKAPKAPEAPQLAPPPQQAQAPDQAGMKRANAAAYGGTGQDSTMLTGLSGIAPSSLSLAKNVLLGS
jgi:hypothetical protein